MYTQNIFSSFEIRAVYDHSAVKTSRTQKCRVQNFRTVRCCKDQHTFGGIKTIHLRKQLVQCLLTLVVSAAITAVTALTDRIDLIDKDDTRCMKFRLGKHITHTGCTDTDKHFHEIGTGNAEERNTRFSCHGFRQQGLTGSRRADKQHTFRDTCSDLEIFFRFFQEIDNLLQIFFFFLKTGNIFKCNFAVVRHGQGCTAFAKIHHPGIASRRLTAAHRKKYHKDHAD